MAYLSFEDLIAGGPPLAPAEAAALTLAVARKLDDEERSGREPRLPDDHGILLSSTGTIAFVRGPDAPAVDNRRPLSALLMRLLRLDDDGPRAHVPGGLLIVLARNLGYIQLPPTSPDAFRAALERFATSDPTVLAGIFWRAARGKASLLRRVPANADAAHPRVDRRRGGPTRADLRRALREVEHELFDTRNRLARTSTRARPPLAFRPELSMSAMLRWSGVAAGVVLIASIATGSGTRQTRPSSVAAAPAASTPVSIPIVPVSTPPAPARPAVAAPVASPSASRLPARSVSTPSRKAVKPRPAQRAERRPITRDRTATRFAGGARQIGWTLQP